MVDSGAAADRQDAASGELERLVRGDVECGEQLRVGEQAAHARHLAGGGGAVHGRAARAGGVLVGGGVEVRRARQHLIQAREQALRRQPVRRTRRHRATPRRGRFRATGEDDEEEEERGVVRAAAHRRWSRLRNDRTVRMRYVVPGDGSLLRALDLVKPHWPRIGHARALCRSQDRMHMQMLTVFPTIQKK